MARVDYEKLIKLQKTPENIRNVSILAHVDHGKTSIADLLLATNAIVSKRQAGTLRYLDNRPDEQRRGITMKSSSVSLHYASSECDYLVNIIDSPGHIDFTSEVVAAARISDGTLIVVDVLEGMCVQTMTAIDIALHERTKMILVLNKIDKLIVDRNMESEPIFQQLNTLLETINAFIAELRFKDLSLQNEELGDLPEQIEDEFDPSSENVIFASAIDGWGFKLIDFAQLYSEQFELPPEELVKYLWGDFCYNRRTKEFQSGARKLNKKPLFALVVAENLLSFYENIVTSRSEDKVAKIIEKLNIPQTREILNSTNRPQLRAIMSEWLPLATTILSTIIDLVPSPTNLTPEKLSHIIGKDSLSMEDKLSRSLFEPHLEKCSYCKTAPVMAYITKVYSIDKRHIVDISRSRIFTQADLEARREAVRRIKEAKLAEENKKIPSLINKTNIISLTEQKTHNKMDDADQFEFIACARIFSGILKVGAEMYLLPSCFSPYLLTSTRSPDDVQNLVKDVVKFRIEELFMLMGTEVVPIQSAMAGNVVGIGKIKPYMIRSGTIADSLQCVPLIEPKMNITEPFYKCAIEPVRVSDMQSLLQGLKLLVQSDSCVHCVLQENGQYILMTAGQVHLEKCIEDLRSFTDVEFRMSSPMVHLKETIIAPPAGKELDKDFEKSFLFIEGFKLFLHAYPMIGMAQKFITDNFSLLKMIENTTNDDCFEGTEKTYKNTFTTIAVEQLKMHMEEVFSVLGKFWKNICYRVLAVSDSRVDCCLLIDFSNQLQGRSIFQNFYSKSEECYVQKCIVNGFQLAIRAGPICGEPIKDVIFCIMDYEATPQFLTEQAVSMSGVLLKDIKDVLHKTFQLMPCRLMEPFYVSRMVINNNQMGKIQSRLDQYRGKVTETKLLSNVLMEIGFILPVLEGLDFCKKIRDDTQGKISPLLQFSHYEVLKENPYLDEQVNDNEDNSDSPNRNIANKLMIEVRKRKGLPVDEKLVDHAEKQRTLNKKKYVFVGALYRKFYVYDPEFKLNFEMNPKILDLLFSSEKAHHTQDKT